MSATDKNKVKARCSQRSVLLFTLHSDNRCFEVTVPEGVTPGQTINIIVPQTTGESVNETTVFSSVETVRDAALEQVELVDEKFEITDKVKQIDEHYKITERAQAVSAQAIPNPDAAPALPQGRGTGRVAGRGGRGGRAVFGGNPDGDLPDPPNAVTPAPTIEGAINNLVNFMMNYKTTTSQAAARVAAVGLLLQQSRLRVTENERDDIFEDLGIDIDDIPELIIEMISGLQPADKTLLANCLKPAPRSAFAHAFGL